MNRWISVVAIFAMTIGGFGPAIRADEVSVSVPADTKFLVRLDIRAFLKSTLGDKLIGIAKKQAQQELSKGDATGEGPDLRKILEMIGFDPRDEIGAIVVSGSDYDQPEKSLVISISLKKTTGNIVGLLLAFQKYEAHEYGRHTIHSATPDKDQQVYCAIHTDENGNKTVLVAAQRDAVTQQLDYLDGTPASGDSVKTVKLSTDGKPILTIEVFDFPAKLIGDGPQLRAAKLVRGVSLQLAESKGNLDVTTSLTAGTEQQAEQLRQMAQGLIAMMGFAKSIDPDDKDLQQVMKFIDRIKVARDGLSLKVSLSVPVDELSKLIDTID